MAQKTGGGEGVVVVSDSGQSSPSPNTHTQTRARRSRCPPTPSAAAIKAPRSAAAGKRRSDLSGELESECGKPAAEPHWRHHTLCRHHPVFLIFISFPSFQAPLTFLTTMQTVAVILALAVLAGKSYVVLLHSEVSQKVCLTSPWFFLFLFLNCFNLWQAAMPAPCIQLLIPGWSTSTTSLRRC